MKRNLQYIIFLLIILGIACFFRFYNLDNIPSGIYPDEAMNANQAISEPGKIFYPENNGREGFFINLIYLSFSIFGVSMWSLKFVSALIGVLTVLGLYFLTKEILSRNIALVSSLFLALSFWHINFSRIAFRAILVPFCLVFLFYFLFRGFKNKKLSNFIFSGLFFGLGFHTYIAFRLVIPLALLVLISWWLIHKKENQQKRFFIFVACWLLATFLVALPIGIYFLNHPEYFASRSTDVSIFSQVIPVLSFGKSLTLHLGMFNFFGDPNWRHNFSGSPQLLWPIGIFFLTGIVLSIKRLVISLKKKDYSLLLVYSFLLGWFFIMLLPGVLTHEGVPHALRTIGAIPPIYIFAGMGALYLYKYLFKIIKNKKVLISICLLLILCISYAQFHKYFVSWAEKPQVENAFEKTYSEIGHYLNSLPLETKKYIVVNRLEEPLYGISIPAQSVMFIESTKFGQPRAIYLRAENLDQIKQEKAIIIALYNESLSEEIQKRFPNSIIKKGNGFSIYEIK